MVTRTELADEQVRQAEAARIQAEGEAAKLDETVPGGKYEVDGRTVNADGKEVGKSASTDLESLTVVDLKDQARDKGIEGFSTMNKAELIDALK